VNRQAVLSLRLLLVGALVLGAARPTAAQAPGAGGASTGSRPEMHRLFRAFLGQWSVRENFERNEYSPGGGSRTGTVTFTVGAGGSALIEDYHANGSAGRLDITAVVWWDPGSRTYRKFSCRSSGTCAMRGAAHWAEGSFVSEYTEPINGLDMKLEDVYSEITPRSIKLVSGIPGDGGKIQLLITSEYQRAETTER